MNQLLIILLIMKKLLKFNYSNIKIKMKYNFCKYDRQMKFGDAANGEQFIVTADRAEK